MLSVFVIWLNMITNIYRNLDLYKAKNSVIKLNYDQIRKSISAFMELHQDTGSAC